MEPVVMFANCVSRYREVIDQFDEDLHVLSKIPVLPALLDTKDEDSGHGSNRYDEARGKYLDC